MRVTEIASTISNKAKHQIIGIRPGEKIHEQMIGRRILHIHMNMMIILRFFLPLFYALM